MKVKARCLAIPLDAMIDRESVERYVKAAFPGSRLIEFETLGSGAHGTGFSMKLDTPEGISDYAIKVLSPHGLGHDYPSDRAAVFLLAQAEYGNLPRHAKAVDVIARMPDGSWRSVGGGREYYLVMERVSGRDYFEDLRAFKDKASLDDRDRARIASMTAYLASIHSVKKHSPSLYRRKLRDTIGHGECLMGVFDSYPDGTLSFQEMADIEKVCVDVRARLKPLHARLSQIHGDFHPGNIWFEDNTFVLLDRSRGPYGEPADDVTALTVNYLFFSVKAHGRLTGAYREAFSLFFREYLRLTGDGVLPSVLGLFFAFRGAVVANPAFYPEVTPAQRSLIFSFVRNVLTEEAFDFENPDRYLEGGNFR